MSNHARKYIWMGAGGGLLQFALIALIAFSGADSPARSHLSATAPASKQTIKEVSPARSTARTGRVAGPPTRSIRVERASGTDAPPDRTDRDVLPVRPRLPLPRDGEPREDAPAEEPPGAPADGVAASPPTEPPVDPVTDEDSGATPDQNDSTPEPALQPAGGPPTRPVEGEAPADPPAPAAIPAAVPADLGVAGIEQLIRDIFGEQGAKAVRVAHCESELDPDAQRGQFLGLFQMGAYERAEYGYGRDPLAQIEAAYRLFLARGWQPWVCG